VDALSLAIRERLATAEPMPTRGNWTPLV
jgi:hypothetical protein